MAPRYCCDGSGLSRSTTSSSKGSCSRCRGGLSLPVLVCELLGEPEIVMLLCPVEIDLPGTHGLERALHPERADIDVSQDQRDEQDGHDGMHDLRELHLGDIGSIKRKQQQKSRHRDKDAGNKGKPIDEFLAQVKAARRGMFVLDEAAASVETFDINPLQKIILEKNHRDQDQARDKREAEEIVHILRSFRDIRERIRADDRQKQNLAEGDVETGQPQDDEGYRGQPMRKPLKRPEPQNLLAGAPRGNPDPSDEQIAQSQYHDAAEADDGAAPMLRAITLCWPAPPFVSGW